jgi:tetratricopeptide (TPR) repeat protein
MKQENAEFDGEDAARRTEQHAHAEGNSRIYQAMRDLFITEVHQNYTGNPSASVLTAHVVVEQITNLAFAPGFVGREDEQHRLLQAIDPSCGGPATMVVSAVSGMAGIGKTALARQVAATAVDRDWFPGGAFFLDFRGYTAEHVKAASVYSSLLCALGVPIDQIPLDSSAQSSSFQRLLFERARSNMRMLFVWDNVSTSEQIVKLVPELPHRAMITSRHMLADIGDVRMLNLDILNEQKATNLMRVALCRQDPDDTRLQSEPEQVNRLAELCGGLPLALRIAVALLAEDPTLTVGGLAQRLSSVRDRLRELRYGDNWGVHAAFDSSYQYLGAEQARMFRLLAVNPGPHIGLGAAAALNDLPEDDARHLLTDLRRAHLVEPGPVHGTYRFHDLLRIYAVEDCRGKESAEQLTEAFNRLADYHLKMSRAADSYLDPAAESQPSNIFADRHSALVWLETERPNLTSIIGFSATAADHSRTRDLSLCLYPFFDLRKYWDDWVSTHRLALNSVRQLGDRISEGVVLNNLGRAYRELRNFDEAIDHLEQALAIFRGNDDRQGQGLVLNNIGNVYDELGRFDEAVDSYQHGWALFRQVGDHHMEARVLNNMGNDYAKLQRIDDAIEHHEKALTIFRELENKYGQAHVLDSLGNDYDDLGQFNDAIDYHLRALGIFREIGERYGEGRALVNLCGVHAQIQQFDAAVEYGGQALEIFRDVGDRYGEGRVLVNLGSARAQINQLDQALAYYQDALNAFDDAGAPQEAAHVRALLSEIQ